MIAKLGRHIKQYSFPSFLTVLFMVGEAFLEILIPTVMAGLIDTGLYGMDISKVYRYGFIMIALVAGTLAFGTLSGVFGAIASGGFAANLREAVFRHIQGFDFANIDKFSGAGLITRLTTDITNIQNAYQMMLRMTMRALSMIAISICMVVVISPNMSVIFFIALLFLSVVMFIVIRQAFPRFQSAFDKYDELNARVQENINGIRVVKSFVQEDYEINRFDKAIHGLYEMFVKAESGVSALSAVMMLTIYASIIAISYMGARQVYSGNLTTGELTSLFTYIVSILMSLMFLAIVLVMITMAEASAKRIAEVLGEESEITNPENPIYEVKDGSLVFKDVCFSYKKNSKKYVLSDINLEISSGQTIGIVGGTGSSKTSLINLISRLYDVSVGSIQVGGVNVKDYDIKTLRDKVSVVLQKNELFSGSILENLRWGNADASLEDCKRVCRIACADEFIDRFPNGYETYVEQGGANLSGGQKQRLCIARALLKEPKIIIFDDSTSAVDMNTDAKIREGLYREIPDTTKIIIAQRISSVKDADKILVLDEGRINGFDTHENLLKNNEIYASIAKVQSETMAEMD